MAKFIKLIHFVWPLKMAHENKHAHTNEHQRMVISFTSLAHPIILYIYKLLMNLKNSYAIHNSHRVSATTNRYMFNSSLAILNTLQDF